MKTVFFGSSDFAVESMRALLNSHTLQAVFTQPDRKSGRHLIPAPTPVKQEAQKAGLPLFQPEDLNAPEVLPRLKMFHADVFVVVSFGRILRREVLDIPRLFCLNVHASLLPRWRGAAPLNWTIIAGDTQSGVTVIRMNEFMDRGGILCQKSIPVLPQDTALSLEKKLSVLGAQALLEALCAVESGTARFTAQDETQATPAPKLKKEDGNICWHAGAEDIHNRVRGLQPWPGAYTFYNGLMLKLLRTEAGSAVPGEPLTGYVPGEIISVGRSGGITAACGGGFLRILQLQAEGKRPVNAFDFSLGHDLKKGTKFSESR